MELGEGVAGVKLANATLRNPLLLSKVNLSRLGLGLGLETDAT